MNVIVFVMVATSGQLGLATPSWEPLRRCSPKYPACNGEVFGDDDDDEDDDDDDDDDEGQKSIVAILKRT